MKKLVKQYSGEGTLIFKDNESAPVSYRIDEFQDFIPDRLGGELPGSTETSIMSRGTPTGTHWRHSLSKRPLRL
jgi:hypothetical protein